MNKGLFGFLTFSLGGGIGYLIAKKLLEEKYAQQAQEEIDSVKAAFMKHQAKPDDQNERKTPSKEEKRVYVEYARQCGYTQEKNPAPELHPRVISPDEFGELEDYDKITLTYYRDGTLTDSNDKPMSADDVEEAVGKESLMHFGEYEEDAVHVRNDRLKVDYEILADQRTYADILRENPHLRS